MHRKYIFFLLIVVCLTQSGCELLSLPGQILGGLFGFRAGGGDVSAGRPYIVGEQGPELFVPNRSGNVVPASQTRQVMNGQPSGGNTNIVINVPIHTQTGSVSPQTRSQVATDVARQMQFALQRNS